MWGADSGGHRDACGGERPLLAIDGDEAGLGAPPRLRPQFELRRLVVLDEARIRMIAGGQVEKRREELGTAGLRRGRKQEWDGKRVRACEGRGASFFSCIHDPSTTTKIAHEARAIPFQSRECHHSRPRSSHAAPVARRPSPTLC